jgi:streptomycin 6-kinase
MTPAFYPPNLIHSLPQDFQEKIQKTWPKIGEKWLMELPNLLKILSNKWSLRDIEPFKNLSYHFVAKALQNNGSFVVLKIGCDREVSLNEYRALRHFSGSGSIKILDYDFDNSALLLEAALPGIPLNATQSKKEAISAYGKVVRAISLVPKPSQDFSQDFPHVRTWLECIEKINDDRINPAWIEKARFLKQYLLSSSQAEQEYLCHGDLHFDNVVSQGDHFLAIDPKGIIGEMAFEASAFDLINTEEIENPNFDSTILLDRIHQLAAALKLNPERLLGWIFLRIMLSIQWSIEDQGDPSRRIKMAEKIYPILLKSL